MSILFLAVLYLAFISLGLPDSLLGAAWPVMRGELAVPVSWAGAISVIIALGTIVSSLQSDRLTRWLGAGRITVLSTALTAVALWGFSFSREFWQLCLWAVPFGLGAGSVDAALNNYVALHYESRHMSWLHSMWGVGASVGPLIMGAALTAGLRWGAGYRIVGGIQLVVTVLLLLSLPLWKKTGTETAGAPGGKALTLPQVLRIPGAKAVMAAFFCYCALEQTAILWGSSYLVEVSGISAQRAAGFAGLFCGGMTVGRILSGFLSLRWNDRQMIRIGQGTIALGLAVLFLLPVRGAAVGLALIGLGCAPVYPCIIHSTPTHFGAEHSQAVIGMQMAAAYLGTCLMPPLFGLLARRFSPGLLPVYLLILLAGMLAMHETLLRQSRKAGA